MYSILYVAAHNDICKCGPFATEDEAMQWANENRFTGSEDQKEFEFDLDETHVYLLHPDHRMVELNNSDFA